MNPSNRYTHLMATLVVVLATATASLLVNASSNVQAYL